MSTGWMSNRGRQNVASFLTKDLGIDWRLVFDCLLGEIFIEFDGVDSVQFGLNRFSLIMMFVPIMAIGSMSLVLAMIRERIDISI